MVGSCVSGDVRRQPGLDFAGLLDLLQQRGLLLDKIECSPCTTQQVLKKIREDVLLRFDIRPAVTPDILDVDGLVPGPIVFLHLDLKKRILLLGELSFSDGRVEDRPDARDDFVYGILFVLAVPDQVRPESFDAGHRQLLKFELRPIGRAALFRPALSPDG